MEQMRAVAFKFDEPAPFLVSIVSSNEVVEAIKAHYSSSAYVFAGSSLKNVDAGVLKHNGHPFTPLKLHPPLLLPPQPQPASLAALPSHRAHVETGRNPHASARARKSKGEIREKWVPIFHHFKKTIRSLFPVPYCRFFSIIFFHRKNHVFFRFPPAPDAFFSKKHEADSTNASKGVAVFVVFPASAYFLDIVLYFLRSRPGCRGQTSRQMGAQSEPRRRRQIDHIHVRWRGGRSQCWTCKW